MNAKRNIKPKIETKKLSVSVEFHDRLKTEARLHGVTMIKLMNDIGRERYLNWSKNQYKSTM